MNAAITMIPITRLVLSEANARRTDAESGIEELVASIKTHGLLQNLTVRALGKERTAQYEVIAGGRRLTALKKLVETGHLSKEYLVPCRILKKGDPIEASLAENVVRAPLHPADQFEAFSALHRDGSSASEIAGRFGLSPILVEQRLKLAAVSPRLLSEYRTGSMNLDQLVAFAISDDHEAQERVWFNSPLHDRSAHAIRRALTNALVEGTDRRALFVGAAAYEAAGGVIVRDLFQDDGEGYFANSELLDRLANEKLSAAAEAVRAEGWSWVEVLPALDHGHLARHGRINPDPTTLSEEEKTKLESLSEEYDQLIEECGEEPAPDIDAQLERISKEIDRLTEAGQTWSDETKASAGAILALDFHGTLRIERGLVKVKAESKEPSAPQTDGSTNGDTRDPQKAKLSDSLVADLTAHRTAALQAVLTRKPDIALTAILHTLTESVFFGRSDSCLQIRLTKPDLKPYARSIGESRASEVVAVAHQKLRSELPPEQDLWAWLEGLERKKKLALLAHCVAHGANAVVNGFDRTGAHHEQADQLARALEIDMADWWKPTREAILDRMSKAQILEAIAEAESREAANSLEGLKKDAMIERAEPILIAKRWLPEPLRNRQPEELHEQEKAAS